MSWALSCLTFKKVYGAIELVTDKKGKAILIDALQLPYTEVKVVLDQLNHYPKKLWAIGKLYTYSIQNDPFIHVDGDVYIWERFDAHLEKAQLVGQHVDGEEGHYDFALGHLKNNGIGIPGEITADLSLQGRIRATNAGIIGGRNTAFFKEYADRAFSFIDSNRSKITPSLVGSSYALIYEQLLFSVMARAKGIEVAHYIDEGTPQLQQLTDFMRKYGTRKYVHLFGSAKTRFDRCRELELQLRTEYPEYYENVIRFINNTNA